MSDTYCEYAFDHDPCTTCDHCGEEVDCYGNTESDFRNCCFPDCGCDGARLCMAGEANKDALKCNVEGMNRINTPRALQGRRDLRDLCYEQAMKGGAS